MKERYESPEMEVIELDTWHDIVTSSQEDIESVLPFSESYGDPNADPFSE